MLRKLKRPSLAWMSLRQIHEVRGQIIGLYLEPDEALRVRAPAGFFGVSEAAILGGSTPLFSWLKDEPEAAASVNGVVTHVRTVQRHHKAWLKLVSWKPPYWDLQIDDGEIESVPFTDERVALPVALLKSYSRHFPFVSTDNYLVNAGECVA